jgi:hypothetical protein
VIHCHRVATYQINPRTGRSILIIGSVRFEDYNGVTIDNIVGPHITNTAPHINNTRMWFWSSVGGPIYLDNGVFYTHTGDVYSGDVSNYQPGAATDNSAETHAKITIRKCWIRFSLSSYLPATKITKTTIVNNSPIMVNFVMVAGDIYELPEGATVVDELPSPVYEQVSQTVTDESPSLPPSNFPISGFACSWIILYPTNEDPELGEVVIGDGSYDISGSETLNSEDPFGTVVPPTVLCNKNAIVKLIYRVRTSPVLISEPPSTTVDGVSMT